jgi:hypothetical protein
MWDHWLRIAMAASVEAVEARATVHDAHHRGNDQDLGLCIEAEFRASMTAICAVSFAIDAIYGSVKDRAGPHPSAKQWSDNGLAREKQIAEYLRWAFKIGPKSHREIRSVLRQIFDFRDEAVHPGMNFREAVYREDIDRGVDPRLMRFRADNAETALRAGLTIAEALLRDASRAVVAVQEWVAANQARFLRLTGRGVGQPVDALTDGSSA